MGSGVLWKIIFTQHSHSYIKKCNMKLYYAKRKAFINFAQKRRRVLWALRHWKCVLWSDESTFQLVIGKNGHLIICAKDEKDHPDCYQRKVQKTASVMVWVWGCISANGLGDLHICEDTNKAEAYVGILETNAASRQRLLPGTPCLFQQDNARPHSARVTRVWLRRYRVHVRHTFSVFYRKCMAHHEEENQTTATTDC